MNACMPMCNIIDLKQSSRSADTIVQYGMLSIWKVEKINQNKDRLVGK